MGEQDDAEAEPEHEREHERERGHAEPSDAAKDAAGRESERAGAADDPAVEPDSADGPDPADEPDPSDTAWWSEQLHTVSTPAQDVPLTRTGIAGLVCSLVAFLALAFLPAALVAAVGVMLSVHGLLEVRNDARRGFAYAVAGIAIGSVAFLATLLFYVVHIL